MQLKAKALRVQTRKRKLTYIRNNWDLYLMLIPALTYIVIYKFLPLFGLTIATKEKVAARGKKKAKTA